MSEDSDFEIDEENKLDEINGIPISCWNRWY
jgi:hypothetical protein